jgi:hypothetical protein
LTHPCDVIFWSKLKRKCSLVAFRPKLNFLENRNESWMWFSRKVSVFSPRSFTTRFLVQFEYESAPVKISTGACIDDKRDYVMWHRMQFKSPFLRKLCFGRNFIKGHFRLSVHREIGWSP